MRDPRNNPTRDPSNIRKVRGVYKSSSTDILSEGIGQVSGEEAEKRAVNGESAIEVIPVFTEFEGEQLLYVEQEGERWYVGTHMMEQLGYKNPKQAVFDMLNADKKEANNDSDLMEFREDVNYMSKKISYSSKTREMLLFNREGINAIFFRSKKPIGKKLRQIYAKFESERQCGNVIAITKEQAMALTTRVETVENKIKQLETTTHKILPLAYQAKISRQEYLILIEMVQRLAELSGLHATDLWHNLCRRFGVLSFQDMNQDDYDHAQRWLNRKLELLLVEERDRENNEMIGLYGFGGVEKWKK